MAIGTFSELKTAAAAWQARSDLTATIPDAIALAEARLNRVLGEVLTNSPLTGVVGSREISISSISMAAPIGLFLAETTGLETEITPRVDGTFAYNADTQKPKHYAISGSTIILDSKCDSAYTFRFKHRQRFALSDASPTNWLLTNHPDIYLAATLVWGGLFTEDDGRAAKFTMVLDEGIPSVKAYVSRQNRGLLSIDPGLADIGRRDVFNFTTGE